MTVFVIKHSHFSFYIDFSKRTALRRPVPTVSNIVLPYFTAYTLSLIHFATDIDLSHSSAPND